MIKSSRPDDMISDAAQTDYLTFKGTKFFGSLDGLRALSIIGVLYFHGPGANSPWTLLRYGYIGVDLFFTISGFLITTLILRQMEAPAGFSLRKFYTRRALRIIPLYYLVVGVLALSSMLMAGTSPISRQFLHDLPFFLAFTVNWFVPVTSPFQTASSLSTEEQFYLIWPLVEKFAAKQAVMIAAGTIIIRQAGVWILPQWLPDDNPLRFVLREVSVSICLGVLLAHALHRPRSYRALHRVFGPPSASLVMLMALGVTLEFALPSLAWRICMAALVAACVIREGHWLRRILAFPSVARIGVVSYGIYLLHAMVYQGLGWAAGRDFARSNGGFWIVFAVSWALAEVSYRYYEQRFLKMKP